MTTAPLATPAGATAAQGLCHPVTLAALATWLVNDHLLKGLGPGWLTGKLSDVACLMVVPWMPLVAYALVSDVDPPLRRTWLVASCVGAGLVMATINVFDAAAWGYRHGLGTLQWPFQQLAAALSGHELGPLRPVQLAMDPSDLATLPALAVPLWVGRGR